MGDKRTIHFHIDIHLFRTLGYLPGNGHFTPLCIWPSQLVYN